MKKLFVFLFLLTSLVASAAPVQQNWATTNILSPPGSSGTVLTSTGPNTPPTFQAGGGGSTPNAYLTNTPNAFPDVTSPNESLSNSNLTSGGALTYRQPFLHTPDTGPEFKIIYPLPGVPGVNTNYFTIVGDSAGMGYDVHNGLFTWEFGFTYGGDTWLIQSPGFNEYHYFFAINDMQLGNNIQTRYNDGTVVFSLDPDELQNYGQFWSFSDNSMISSGGSNVVDGGGNQFVTSVNASSFNVATPAPFKSIIIYGYPGPIPGVNGPYVFCKTNTILGCCIMTNNTTNVAAFFQNSAPNLGAPSWIYCPSNELSAPVSFEFLPNQGAGGTSAYGTNWLALVGDATYGFDSRPGFTTTPFVPVTTPSIVASNYLACATGTNLVTYIVPSGVTNMYQVVGYSVVTAFTSGTAQSQVNWTDENGTARSVALETAIGALGANSFTATTIYAKGGTKIFVTNAFSLATTLTYDSGAAILGVSQSQ